MHSCAVFFLPPFLPPVASAALAASPDQEKAFVDAYKTAFEANDTATLEGFLFTKARIPMALEFYKMMMSAEAGAKISEITLEDLTPEDVDAVSKPMEGPDGSMAVLLPKPYKKLVIKIETKDGDGSSTSTSTSFVAEKDGKLGIAVPHAAP